MISISRPAAYLRLHYYGFRVGDLYICRRMRFLPIFVALERRGGAGINLRRLRV